MQSRPKACGSVTHNAIPEKRQRKTFGRNNKSYNNNNNKNDKNDNNNNIPKV